MHNSIKKTLHSYFYAGSNYSNLLFWYNAPVSLFYLNHHTNIINRHLDKLHDNLSVRHDGHKFECPIKYLEHWKNNVDHNLLPIKQINQIIKQEHNRQHEMEHSYTMDM